MVKKQTDIAIIGAGPAGLFAAFEAGMLGMKAIVLDVLDVAGGQCSVLYPEKPIFDIPSQPMITGESLVDNLKRQNIPFGVEYMLGQSVDELMGEAGDYTLRTSLGNEISAKAVIISAGSGLFGPNRPPIAGIEEFEGKSVLYYVNDRAKLSGKKIMIAGGGDSAVDWANNLAEIAEKIFVIHRRDKFRAHDASVAKMREFVKAGKIELIIPHQLNSLKGDNGWLSEVITTDFEDKESSFAVDYLLAFFGLRAELGPIANWGIGLDKSLIKVDCSTMMTNLTGVFAIGDICTYAGKLKLILTGFSEAARACYSSYNYVFPNKALHFEYSTSKLAG